MSIEDIILSHDQRGISALRSYLPHSYCDDAANLILDSGRKRKRIAIITTGFFILRAEAPETDGPLGALAMAHALNLLGFDVIFVIDKYTVPLFETHTEKQYRFIEFPITDHETSKKHAQHILSEVKPSILISIERCGLTEDCRYLNMGGKDISDYTAKIDYLFIDHHTTIGIGDGGNEIGMGNLFSQIKALPDFLSEPALTRVSKLVIASISNWGAYGLLTALSRLCKQNLLPSVEWEKEMLSNLVAKGAVDGVTAERQCAVDGFTIDQNAWALTQLNRILKTEQIS